MLDKYLLNSYYIGAMSKAFQNVNLAELFDFSMPPLTLNKDCIASFKICKKNFKYSISSKWNLNHHISNAHPEINSLQSNEITSKSTNSETLIFDTAASSLQFKPFARQDAIT